MKGLKGVALRIGVIMALTVFVLALASFSGMVYAPIPPNCTGATYAFFCGDNVNETCDLTGDLYATGIGCFVVDTDNVTINGNGHTIVGDGTSSMNGVYATNNNVTIKNMTITGFDNYGIAYDGASYGRIESVVITNITSWAGIRLLSASDNNVVINNVIGPMEIGVPLIVLSSSNSNRVEGNNLYDAPNSYAMNIEPGSNNNTILNNNFTNVMLGIHLTSPGNNITGNRIDTTTLGAGYGIWAGAGSANNNISDNTFVNTDNYDIVSTSAAGTDTYTNNILSSTIPVAVSFTCGENVGVDGVTTTPSDPSGQMNIGEYVKVEAWSPDSWLYLNITYNESALGFDENDLTLWKYTSGDVWENVTTAGIDTANDYIYSDNLTTFSVFAPMGPGPVIIPCDDTIMTDTTLANNLDDWHRQHHARLRRPHDKRNGMELRYLPGRPHQRDRQELRGIRIHSWHLSLELKQQHPVQ
jgi:hypothetical protein